MVSRYSYFIRLITFTTLISTIPLMFLGIYAFFQSTSTVQTKVNEANVFILQQSQSRVEQILKVIDQVSRRYAETPLVVGAISKRMEIEDFQDIDLLVKGLLGVQTYELGVKDVELHSLRNDWYIKDGGFYFGKDTVIKSFSLDSAFNSRWSPELDHTFTGIKLVKTIPSTTADPKGYLSVRVSNIELAKLLTGGFSTRETMIVDDKMNIIIHTNEKRIGQSVLSEPWSQELQNKGKQQGYFNSTSLGKPYSVVYNHSRYNNWTYVSIIPIEEAKKESASIGWATLTACLLLLLFTGLLSYWGSKRIYFPVRSLMEFTMKQSGPSGEVTVVKDELQWIGTQFASLHQSKEQLEGKMKMQSGQLVDYFMLKLFQGELNRSELEGKMSQFQLPAWRRYAVLVMQIDTFAQTRYSSNEQDLLLFAMNNMASELIPTPQRIHAMPIGNYQVTLVGSDAESHGILLSELSGLAESVQRAVDEFLGLKVSVGISRPYETMYATPQAFLEAKEALQYRIRLGEKAILHIGDLKPQMTSQPYYPHHLVSKLIQAITFLDRDEAGDQLRQFIQEVLKAASDPALYRMSFAMLLTDLVRVTYDIGAALIMVSQEHRNKYEQLFNLKTPEEIEDWFKSQMIAPMMELTREVHEFSGKSISRSVKDLIHDHYDSDLTLEQCAMRLNYSTHYIRRMFRKETGMNFSEYLARFRHDMAKSWLSETEMKITEVAERLQYTNAQNFIRQFRKLEGMTPGQYREQKLKESV
ncbi:two-component system response regulator YesN [Paenibacillus sp. V4I3]|uniref:helix-turn-helix domain-containing protein n=1 Tax=unclassified Paenibacillus TaxID=185978 RepID=UPI00278AE3E2|nr:MULTISPECIES: helix-turn-helix domain-containing protein [unclassified Paenibacillus]MDQ0877246.1 two-component system response regulator YesN [Paenibacillus sp. V4I3]MDQ0886875.1 two-component system response regulator YesN [Paenibacillus sp. V4I9]